MIQAKKVLPEVYSESYDMSVFTGLLDLVYTARELNSSIAKGLHNPATCFEEFLPRLASLFNLNVTASRQLLSDYRLLVKHKGTSLAIQALAALAAGLDPQKDLVKIVCTNSKVTAYLDFTVFDNVIAEQLIYRLAPLGTFVQIRNIREQ